MLRSRFLWKLYAGYVVAILTTASVVGVIVTRRLVQDAVQDMQRALQTQAVLLRDLALPLLQTTTPIDAQSRVHLLGAATGTRFTVIRSDGTVVADSEEESSRMDNHVDRPEIIAAHTHGTGSATRFSHTLGMRMMYLALPVSQNGQLVGYVRTSLPLTVMHQRLSQLRTLMLVGIGVAMAVGLGLGFVWARGQARPFQEVMSTAALLAGESEEQRVWRRSRDEVGELADVLNRMMLRFHERMEALAKEHNQLLAVLGSMVEGVIAVDRHERVVHMNQAAGTMLHISPDTSIGKHVWEVTRVRSIVETVADALRGDDDLTREAHVVHRLRDQVIELHASPLRNSEGDLAGAVVVLHDVTELRRLEDIRREFVANVSHELKTPITTIKGFIETLRDGALDDRQQAERFLEIMARHADRLHAIIEDLLSLSRLEQDAEPWELPRTQEVLANVLQEASQDCAIKAAARQIAIVVSCDPDIRVWVNGPLLEQAVVNLLDNAVKYSKRGGTVWLEAMREAGGMLIRVRDQGVGIPQEHLPRLFERFYRVDKARSRDHGGTGLGLAIVKHIALIHGGRVSVESKVGEGSVFMLHLPDA